MLSPTERIKEDTISAISCLWKSERAVKKLFEKGEEKVNLVGG